MVAVGNMTEWFDYGVYAYTAVHLGEVFFPGDDPTASTLGSLLVFAVSFLVRPLGGLVWGPLVTSSAGSGCSPPRSSSWRAPPSASASSPGTRPSGCSRPPGSCCCGWSRASPTGGEYGGAATATAEYAPDHRRGRFGSFLEFGTLGATLVLVTELVVGADAMADWGWRLPFLVAAPLGLVGLCLRSRLEDTPVFREAAAEGEIDRHLPGVGARAVLAGLARPDHRRAGGDDGRHPVRGGLVRPGRAQDAVVDLHRRVVRAGHPAVHADGDRVRRGRSSRSPCSGCCTCRSSPPSRPCSPRCSRPTSATPGSPSRTTSPRRSSAARRPP